MIAKQKAVQFLADYKEKLVKLNDKLAATEKDLEDLSLQIRFIDVKELPEAIEIRVLSGDSSRENRVRKQLQKLQAEYTAKSEDLIVVQNIVNRHKQQAADEIKPIQRLFTEEKNIVAAETYDRLTEARTAYINALQDTDILHTYRDLERGIQEIEVAAGRRKYVDTILPIDQLKLNALSVNSQDVARTVKRI